MKLNILAVLMLTFNTAWAKVQVIHKTLKEATHFELTGLDQWRYFINRDGKTVSVNVQGVTPEELKNLENFKDKRIFKVSVETGVNNAALIKFQLREKMSFFDYQTDSPSMLVFDIFSSEPKPKKLPKKVTVKEFVSQKSKPKSKLARDLASIVSDKIKIGYQPPILGKGGTTKDEEKQYNILDYTDKNYDRFLIADNEINPDAYLKFEQEVLLKFPAYHTKIRPTLDDLDSNKTQYHVEIEDNEENQMTRLLLRLYGDKNYAVTLKTFGFFREKFPTSKYDEILHILKADTYYNLWRKDNKNIDFESAIGLYKEHLVRYPNSPYKDKLAYLIGVAYFENKQYIEALNHFQSISKNKEASYYWQTKMYMAGCYKMLKQTDSALQELTEIENNYPPFAHASRFARGDVYFVANQLDKALSEYNEALKKYPKDLKNASNIYFNSAEINYLQKDYKKSLTEFRNFLKTFPDHEHASYAMGRIAKILDVLGVSQEKVLKANLETFYRYKGTPASYLSKVKINVDRAQSMKPKEALQVIGEIENEAPVKEIEDVKNYAMFKVADIYSVRKEYEKAQGILYKFVKENINSPHLNLAKSKIYHVLTSKINDLVESNKDMQAIQYYLKNKDTWLKDNQRIDSDYILGQAYEKIHLNDDAAKFYEKALSKLKQLDVSDEKRRILNELPIDEDKIHLKLAKNYFKEDNLKKASIHLDNVKFESKLNSTEKIEYNVIKATVNEKEAKYDVALVQLKKLCDFWSGKPELLIEPYYKISKIYELQKNTQEALLWSEKAIKLIGGAKFESLNKDLVREVLKYSAELESKNKNYSKAIGIYKQIIEKFTGSDTPLASIRYSLGKLYFDQNDVRGAELVWALLKEEKDATLWLKMAQENLAQMKWSEKLKRYVRKPAGETK
ncbi:MAG: tetratricopeptide repeat protein [Oligoflexia bacterium]|nr:tetratricopeptide repeat protein [Oligoflexia bacterium]